MRLLRALSCQVLKPSKDGDCTVPLCDLFLCLDQRNVFPYIKSKPLSFQLMSLVSPPCTTAAKSLALSSSHPLSSTRRLLSGHINVFSKLNNFSSLSLSLLHPLTTSVVLCSNLATSLNGELKLGCILNGL